MQERLKSVMRKRTAKTFARLCFASLLGIMAMPSLAQETSLNAPEVLDLDDPFARGINRAADQASGGIALPDPNGQSPSSVKTGKDLLGRSNARALAIDLYRVAALAVTEGSARGQIFEESNQDVEEGSRPQIPYLRIGSFNNSATARQAAINLKSIMEDFIGGHFILRSTSVGIDLDIGPLHTVQHAENYCELMLKRSNGLVSDCYAVLEYPGYEPLDTFKSSAMLRLSANAVETVIDDDNLFDLTSSARQLLKVKEGDMLGTGVDQIVKIIPNAVILVSDEGEISSLPLDYIPEKTFENRPAETVNQPQQPVNTALN